MAVVAMPISMIIVAVAVVPRVLEALPNRREREVDQGRGGKRGEGGEGSLAARYPPSWRPRGGQHTSCGLNQLQQRRAHAEFERVVH